MTTFYHDTIAADGPVFAGLGCIGSGGTVIGSPVAVAGPTADTGDAGYQFNGTTEYVETGYDGSPTSGGLTIELWVYPASSGAGGYVLGAAGGSGFTDAIDVVVSGSSGGTSKISFTLGSTGTNYCIFSLNTVFVGVNLKVATWNHCVFTFDGVTGKVYVNGIRCAQAGASAPFIPSTLSPLLISAQGQPFPAAPLNFYDGAVSNVAFYTKPLPPERILMHYAARAGVPAYPASSTFTGDYYPTIITDGPIAYYRCDETAGAMAVDRSGRGHHGAYGSGSHTLNEPGAIYDGDTAIALQEVPPGYWDATPANLITPLVSSSFSTQFSIECWVYVTSLPDVGVICATEGQIPVYDGPGFSVVIETSGAVTATATQSGLTLATITTAAPLPAGQYNYIAVTFDDNELLIYVNGVLWANVAAAFSLGPWDANLVWGCYPVNFAGDAGQLLADLDEAAIYAYALTPGQIYTHWKAGLGPLVPPAPPVIIGNDQHYFEVLIFNKKGELVDLPQADIDSLSLLDQLNGGSATSTMSFIRDFNQIGAINYLFSVHVRVWNGRIARPVDPTWNGYMVDIDQEKTRTLGKITVHLEGDQKQLDRASVYEDVNPLVGGNPPLDAADYVRHLFTTYAPGILGGGPLILACPPTLFSLLPGQYEMMQLGQVIDTVLKTGRDDLGNLVIWRVNCAANLTKTLLVEPDQDPNTVTSAKFHYVMVDGMCAKYTIKTKYSDIINNVTIQGGQDYITGLPVVGSYLDVASLAAYGAWQQIISVWQLISSAAANSYAQAYLDIHGNAQAQGDVELHNPDPYMKSGQWVQIWENASSLKQMRIASVRWEVGRSRIRQTLSPTAPTPYLDQAVYKMGLNSSNNGVNQINKLPVNTQQNFVRTSGLLVAH